MASTVMVRSFGVADNDLVETRSHRTPGSAGWLVATLLVYLWPVSALAGPPLETETARVPAQGVVSAENVFEAQDAADGNEFALPLAFTYGLTDRVELLVEPVLYTSIQPRVTRQATGIGDLEVTTIVLVHREAHRLPAFALAGEIKVPTARNLLIGTRKADYTGYLIASKQIRLFDLHANLGYTLVGKPAGVRATNMLLYAAAVEYRATRKLDIVSELLGNSAGSAVAETNPVAGSNPVAAEIAGAELVGLIGMRYHATPRITYSFGVTYDNNRAVLFRPGVTIEFP
jgi:hypothetical protein